MKRHAPLLTAWAVCIAVFVIGVFRSGTAGLLGQLSSMVLAVLTAKRAELTGVLQRPWLYRAALGLLLLMTATVLFAAGSTVAFGAADHAIGYVVLAATNLIAAVATWRALVRPAPRRAATVGLFAVVVELVAMIIDIVINFRVGGPEPHHNSIAIALLASYAATWAGALVCIAVLLAFVPEGATRLPSARVVIEDN